jgi:Ca2+:H+ antiporter
MGRRTTSTHVPHKGEPFSVDDDEDEVAQERERHRERQARLATGSLRRQPSTLRRRPAAVQPSLSKVDSIPDEDAVEETQASAPTDGTAEPISSGEEATLQAEESGDQMDDQVDGDEGNVSDAESFTLKDRQEAINTTHPFGIRIWKPALYKKSRSVQRNAEGDIHSSPGLHVSSWLLFCNLLWTLMFGWWLSLLSMACAILVLLFATVSESSWEYATVLKGLSKYLFYPFGKYVKLIQDEAYAEEDEGEGRSISEYEQWQSGDLEEGRLFFGPVRSLIGRRRPSADSRSETESLLGRPGRHPRHTDTGRPKRRLFGRGKWNVGRIVFYVVFYSLICPPLFLVSGICWLFVFTIPMGRVTLLLIDHIRRHPLALSFHSESTDTRYPGEPPSSILLCTYRAVGLKYWKYTIDGTNIFLINLLAVVAFTIFDFYVLYEGLHLHNFLTNTGFIFALALFSIIPLAYFIGQAVASISAQSSMGVGATINAFFSTIVEVFLYCVALNEGKAQLVEGSIIGSIFAGVLFLPGLSMCFGALKRKTQRFNVKSAGVTSTMMLFAVIGAFGPTLFYQIYGSVSGHSNDWCTDANRSQHELKCHQCKKEDLGHSADRDCRRCFFSQATAVHDKFYISAVQPYIWFSATMLFLSYVIGLLFTLRTHAAVIWSSEPDEKKGGMDTMATSQISNHPESTDPHALTRQNTAGSTTGIVRSDIRDSQLYQRILGQSLKQVGMSQQNDVRDVVKPNAPDGQPPYPPSIKSPHIVPPKSRDGVRDGDVPGLHLHGLSDQDNSTLTRQIVEMAATAATVAARDATKTPHKAARMLSSTTINGRHSAPPQNHHVAPPGEVIQDGAGALETTHAPAGGHDAPNWSRTKSAVILLTATVAYAVIAEILVDTVDSVLTHVDIDEKFLGITLFALVPNTTEFLVSLSSLHPL